MAEERISQGITTEKELELNLSTESHKPWITAIGKALSSAVRIDILNLIKVHPLSLQEISRRLGIPLSSTALHISCLEDAHLVSTESQPGIHGSMRVCMCDFISFHLEAYDTDISAAENTLVYQMPLGNYTDFQVEPSCGLAGMNGVIDTFDDPRSFYSTDRQQAQLIWFSRGYIEYRFPNKINPLWNIQEMIFSMELCSEAPGYNAQWPSDITFSVNGTEIGTYTCPGDLGARRGRLTPNVWPIGLTQYGFMTGVSLRKDGCYINEIKVNDENILETVRLSGKPYISLRIGVRPDAINQGGINLFGEKYGDFPQGINMRIVY